MQNNYRLLLSTLLVISFWALGCPQSAKAQPVLVKDINAVQPHVSEDYHNAAAPQRLVNVNGTLFFVAYQAGTGTELWKSDGTAAGTRLVKDVRWGTLGSLPDHLTSVNGTLFFTVEGSQLWKSDGTETGTVLVKSIYRREYGLGDLTNVNGTLFFTADGSRGRALYKSDGTEGGTVLLKDEFYYDSDAIANLTNVNGVLFFSARDDQGIELWKSDGTTAGTRRVKDVNAGEYSSNPGSLTAAGSQLYFTAYDDESGYELWKSDGTAAGTRRVKDINPGSQSAFYGESLTQIAYVNGLVFFIASDGSTGYALWRSDGTAAGTRLVKDPSEGAGGLTWNLTVVKNQLYFAALDVVHGMELWKSDGTERGTVLVKDINQGLDDTETPVSSVPSYLVNVNGTLFFTASTEAFGEELWKSDGTEEGTVLVKDISPGSNSAIGNPDAEYKTPAPSLTVVNGLLFLVAQEGKTGFELWRSDGSDGGTVNVADLYRPTQDGLDRNGSITGKGNLVYLTADDGVHGRELWKSDGTESGTVLVKDIAPGDSGSAPAHLTLVNDVLFFTAGDTIHGRELWRSDGTAGGTTLVKDLVPGHDTLAPENLVNVNGTLFFTQGRAAGGQALWKSDGTAAGTRLIKRLTFRDHDDRPHGMTLMNGTLYFFGPDESGALRIWRSDGTAGGTYPVTGTGLRVADTEMVRLGNSLYFVASDGAQGYELWKSNGTERGTSLVKDLNPGSSDASPTSLTRMGNRLYFAATDGEYGQELWRSDGTAAGTVLVKDISYDDAPPRELTVANGTLFFTVQPYYENRHLWKSDGTEEGTLPLKEISPYYDESSSRLTNVNGTLCFVAFDEHGQELWRSDGSEAGTALVADLKTPSDLPYYGGSSPRLLTAVGGTLYFAADDGVLGRELWKYDPAGCPVTGDSVQVLSSIVCVGETAAVVLRNTVAGVRYRLMDTNGVNLLGPTVTGTGGDVTIPLGNVPVGLYTFSVKASGCTEQTLEEDAEINVLGPLAAPNANSVIVFPGQPAWLAAEGAPEGVTYHWYGQATGGAVLKTGYSFTTPPLFAPASYYVAAATPGCRESARTEVTVALRQPAEGLFVNAGGSAYLSRSEKLFTVDQYFRGGRPATPKWGFIEETNDDDLYENGRCGAAFSYHFPVANGTYYVVLHFAETYWEDAGWGKRQFHVDMEGQRKLTNYDIYARAGNAMTAVQETFWVQVTDGELVVAFRRGAADIPLVMALEVMPAGEALRINAGGADYQSVEDKAFTQDLFYRGGQSSYYTSGEIYNTSDDRLYRTGRHGASFDYSLPTGNGAFDVTLHFAETYWGIDEDYPGGGAGSRRFNVNIEGERKLTEYDIFEKAGGAMRAVRETFRVEVGDGQLDLAFRRGSADYPSVKAIEVVPAAGSARAATYAAQEHPSRPESGIWVYPNPVQDQLTIRTERPAAEVTKTLVTQMIGRQLLENKHRLAGPHALMLDVSGLPAGIYAVSLLDGQSWRTVKFVKQ